MTNPSPVQTTGRLTQMLYTEGIAAIPGAFSAEWGEQLAQDFDVLYEEARELPGGTVNRGTNRFYFAIHPERLRGFLDIVAHPTLQAVSEEVLGPDWRIVEVAFDVPLPGALHQPWHRDFPSPPETTRARRLTSLAFNLTCITVTADMGPFEIAPGTQWDDGSGFAYEMFPDPAEYQRYEELAVQKMPRLGDMSVRSGLTIHRGTPNRSTVRRPVLVVGVVGPDVPTDQHGLHVSTTFSERVPRELLRRLDAVVVDELAPIQQAHSIEGLVMGGEPAADS